MLTVKKQENKTSIMNFKLKNVTKDGFQLEINKIKNVITILNP